MVYTTGDVIVEAILLWEPVRRPLEYDAIQIGKVSVQIYFMRIGSARGPGVLSSFHQLISEGETEIWIIQGQNRIRQVTSCEIFNIYMYINHFMYG